MSPEEAQALTQQVDPLAAGLPASQVALWRYWRQQVYAAQALQGIPPPEPEA